MSKGNILLVTFPPFEKQTEEHALRRLKDEGYSLYLLGNGLAKPNKGIFTEHFAVDIRSFESAISALPKELQFHAVVGEFIDRFSPLVAALCERYGVKGNSMKVAYNCRNKYRMRKLLTDAGVSKVKSFFCRTFEDIEEAVRTIDGPCVAKPVGGDSSVGVFYIKSPKELTRIKGYYEESKLFIKRMKEKEFYFTHTAEELSSFGETDTTVDLLSDYVVEEFIEGYSLSVDSLVQDGTVYPMGVAEQIRMKPPFFVQLAERMPYVAPKKRLEELYDVNKNVIQALGVENSPTHIEYRISKDQIEIIEAACRFGGDNIHDSVLQTTGHSLLYEAVKISLGEPIAPNTSAHSYVSMKYLLPEKQGKFKKGSIPIEVSSHPQVTECCITADSGDPVGPPPKSFDFLGYIQVKGNSRDEADKLLADLSERIIFEIDEVV